jgi:hypothetical protein
MVIPSQIKIKENRASGDVNPAPLPNPIIDAVRHWQKFGFTVDTIAQNNAGKVSPAGWTLETPDKAIADHFEQFPKDTIATVLPDRVVAVICKGDSDTLRGYIMPLPAKPLAWLKLQDTEIILYRLSPDSRLSSSPSLPKGIALVQAGGLISLPHSDDLKNSKVSISNISELPELPASSLEEKPVEPEAVQPAKQKANLLDRHSLRGKSEDIRQQIIDEKPLLDRLVLSGQLTLWFGSTNAGKTLIFLSLLNDAIAEGRIDGQQVYYINADDSGSGLATKTELMEDLGCHTVAPGYRGFESHKLDELLTDMAAFGQAKGLFVILDTAKKFVDPMNKKDTSRFATICRSFSMKGGTMLVLAHTNKNAGADGKERYAGTADLPQDFDAAYTMNILSDQPDEKVVEFTKFKGRGDSVGQIAYGFNNQSDLSYAERLASVIVVEPDQIDNFKRIADQAKDSDVIDAVKAAIAEGTMSKMELAAHVSGKLSAGRNAVIKIIERYEGKDMSDHLWDFEVGARGRKTYRLHEVPPPAD